MTELCEPSFSYPNGGRCKDQSSGQGYGSKEVRVGDNSLADIFGLVYCRRAHRRVRWGK